MNTFIVIEFSVCFAASFGIRDLVKLDPVKWKQFEDNHLQELHSFQTEENGAGTSGVHNF